ncbi:hypothetical protein D9619_008169 [Psilocybe cf. subviscida]|uniref:DUF6533 domain-containing protein n=1 Tax=Psilocybe cf. subviscida TaxID=2480587 RepID=A0A8H5AUE7_9AGAR|nr:hypothetical protein D9619_008169 [Psilocybe cf. subviscida]
MEDGDRNALTSALVQQNYAFVASFAVILWECLISFRQEVKYVWCCPSKATKYLFLFCRYYAMGYFIACSIFGTQWTLRNPISSKRCRTWFLIHVASFGFVHTGIQLILTRKVFNLYERSTPLATGLFALHCIQVGGTFIWGYNISASLNFNPICNSGNVPNHIFSVVATVICVQCMTWTLILRKVWKVQPRFFPRWRRYLLTSEAHAKLSCGLCFVAILFNASHSFVNQRSAPVYLFAFPMAVLSVGTCRYILQVEKDRDLREELVEAVNTLKGRGEQFVSEKQSISHGDTLPAQDQHQHSPQPPEETPSPLSHTEALSIRTSNSHVERHNLGAVVSNFPYLRGAESYKLHRNRRSMATTSTNDSPRSSSDGASRHTVSVQMSHLWGSDAAAGLGPVLHVAASEGTDVDDQVDEMEERQSTSNIKIGSLHSSSSLNSEQLRQFYNDTWNIGPFMASGP